jgi:nitroreductase
MKLTRPVREVITARSSRRRYETRPIEQAARRQLEDVLATGLSGPFDSATRFELVAASDGDSAALKGLGTYGFIRNPAGFVVGAVRSGDKDMEDFGFVMESIILLATDLELGTCWLGGTFTKSEFSKRIGVGPGETVPAVCSIGHSTVRRGAVERMIRFGAGSKKRKPWEELFFSGELGVPLSQETAGDFADVLEMVRIAPSASNKQPWRILKERGEQRFHLLLERTPGYGKDAKLVDVADLQRIDMGIAMCHFQLSVDELGIEGRWSVSSPELGALPPGTEYIASWSHEG